MTTKVTAHVITAWERRYGKNFVDKSISWNGPYINSSGYSTWTDTKTGVDNPNWRTQVRTGRNATTNYTVTAEKRQRLHSAGGYTAYDSSNRTYQRGWVGHPQEITWGSLSDPSGISFSSVDLLARQRFVSAYRDARTAFQSGVFLGELKETVKMIRHPASALREGIDRYYRAVKKRLKRSQSRSRKRIIQDTWLEYSFGWRPLIRDVKDACALATASPMAVFEKLKGTADITASNVVTKVPAAHFYVGYTSTLKGTCSVKYQGAIRASTNPPSFPEQLGLSWSNLAPTLWELIPYSFLVDYFTNVGAVIEGISTGPISLAWGCKHVYRQYSKEITSLGFDQKYAMDNPPTSGIVRIEGDGVIAGPLQSRVVYTRTYIDKVSVGIGDLVFKLPGTNTRWLNISALAKLRR